MPEADRKCRVSSKALSIRSDPQPAAVSREPAASLLSACLAFLSGSVHKATNWNLTHRQNVSFRTSAHTGVGISIEFRAIYRHPFVGDGFPVPPEFRDLYGAGRETRPLRCFYGWSDKFPICLFAMFALQAFMKICVNPQTFLLQSGAIYAIIQV